MIHLSNMTWTIIEQSVHFLTSWFLFYQAIYGYQLLLQRFPKLLKYNKNYIPKNTKAEQKQFAMKYGILSAILFTLL